MNPTRFHRLAVATMLLLGLSAPAVAQIGTAFTYQGELKENGQAKGGTVDLKFTAFDPRDAVLGAPVILDGVTLDAQGRFTVQVDFGNVFGFEPTQIEVAVREDASGGVADPNGFTALLPRQQVNPTPLAQFAAQVGNDAVSGSSIVNDSIGSVDLRDGSVRAVDVDTAGVLTGLQRRVSGECQKDRAAIRAINEDGSLQCIYLDAAAAIAPLVADATGDVGEFVSAATAGHRAAYYDRTNSRLKFVTCGSSSCSAPIIVDDTPSRDVGQFASIFSNLSTTQIAYYDATGGDLKLAICPNSICSGTIDLRTIDSAGDVGRFAAATRLAFDGNMVIAYYDATNNQYKVAHCVDAGCSNAQITALTEYSGGGVGGSAIAILDTGDPGARILLLDGGVTPTLVSCANTICNARGPGVVFPGSARAPIALVAPRSSSSTDVNPLWVAYTGTSGNLVMRQCDSDNCAVHRFVGGVAPSAELGSSLSLALRPEGLPMVFGINSAATVAAARMLSRSSFPSNSIDGLNNLSATGAARSYVSAAYSSAGEAGVFYHDANDDLVFQRCARADCSDQ